MHNYTAGQGLIVQNRCWGGPDGGERRRFERCGPSLRARDADHAADLGHDQADRRHDGWRKNRAYGDGHRGCKQRVFNEVLSGAIVPEFCEECQEIHWVMSPCVIIAPRGVPSNGTMLVFTIGKQLSLVPWAVPDWDCATGGLIALIGHGGARFSDR